MISTGGRRADARVTGAAPAEGRGPGRAGASLRDDLAALAAAPRVTADPAAVAYMARTVAPPAGGPAPTRQRSTASQRRWSADRPELRRALPAPYPRPFDVAR